MQIIKYPDSQSLPALLRRPAPADMTAMTASVLNILSDIREHGDRAVGKYTMRFDKIKISDPKVSARELNAAGKKLDKKLKQAIEVAYQNIYKFHKEQVLTPRKIATMPGVACWRENRPIQRVGIYIPGGSAPLFSTVLMLGIPAQIAGCAEVVMCTPPAADGSIHPAICYAARMCGIRTIYKTGGVQAIGAMAYGTAQIPAVDKIFGPGNSYVTLAKQLVSQQGIAIDMPAGPSEVLVMADDSCTPAFVAADLLSQAEHGPDSQVVLVSTRAYVVDAVIKELHLQLEQLPRKEIAAQALRHSKAILVKQPKQAVQIINDYAPEHLILAVTDTQYYTDRVYNAGSVFIGHYTPESAGDYASGTNHTLPTAGFTRTYSGVSVDSFVKKITYQEISRTGLQRLGPTIETMAEAEGLHAHRRAVSIRLQNSKSK